MSPWGNKLFSKMLSGNAWTQFAESVRAPCPPCDEMTKFSANGKNGGRAVGEQRSDISAMMNHEPLITGKSHDTMPRRPRIRLRQMPHLQTLPAKRRDRRLRCAEQGG
jgi:hypothetical protein